MSDSKPPSWEPVRSGSKPAPPTRRSARERAAAAEANTKAGGRRPHADKGDDDAKVGYKGRPYQEPNRFWNYPRPNKGPIHRWLPSWRFVLGSGLTLGVLAIAALVTAYVMIDVPEPEDVALAQGSTVYYADGETEMGSFASINRTIIDAAELPDHVGQAVVASEDRRFYSNVGVDPIGIARAFVNNVLGKPQQGGSTITQQYVERYYLGQTDGYVGKAKEAILALKIDRQQSKDEILGNYMNTIYFGRGANGIEQAAQQYFGKSASELTISESALLAGVIPSPSRWDPAVDRETAEKRWSRTLDYMVGEGFITQAERDEQTFPETIEPGGEDMFGGPQGYLLDMARDELLAEGGFSEEEVLSGGLRIVTTIDPEMQEAAVSAAQDLPEDHAPNLRVGLVSMDPQTGAIRALYGGPDFVEQSFNTATQGRAQGGSTFKVFTLAAALDQGIPLEQRFPSYSPMTVEPYGWEVSNFDLRGHGNISMLQATEGSVNTAYAQINAEVGPEATEEMAIRLGLPEDTAGLEPVISNVLGSASPHVVDMARAYSTIAAGGERTTPHIVAEVTDSEENVRYSGPTESESVLDPQVAADATYAMTQVVERGTGSTASELGRPAAGKTGSSQNYRSAWFVGFVPQLTTAVALYQPGEDGTEEQLSPIGDVNIVAGGTWPTTIWTEYMKQAVDGMPVEEFPERSAPVRPSYAPRPQPTRAPSEEPSQEPSEEPTEEPTTPTPEPTTPTPTPEPTTPTPTPTDDADSGSDGQDATGDSDGSDTTDPGGGDSGENQGRPGNSGTQGQEAGPPGRWSDALDRLLGG